jgi:hypothetical protein
MNKATATEMIKTAAASALTHVRRNTQTVFRHTRRLQRSLTEHPLQALSPPLPACCIRNDSTNTTTTDTITTDMTTTDTITTDTTKTDSNCYTFTLLSARASLWKRSCGAAQRLASRARSRNLGRQGWCQGGRTGRSRPVWQLSIVVCSSWALSCVAVSWALPCVAIEHCRV